MRGYNTNAKVNPPIRTVEDIAAIKEGLRDGTLDAIATDHAPHHRNEKQREFDAAPSGISGLETAVSLSLALVREGVLTMPELISRIALNPARILGLNKGVLAEGADADVAMIDPERKYTVDASGFRSKGKNSPFDGWDVQGMVVTTISMGKVFQWE